MAERQEKLFILTGASRGLGRALAEQLLREAGCTLLTLSRQPLAALQEQARQSGAQLVQWQQDLTDAPAAARWPRKRPTAPPRRGWITSPAAWRWKRPRALMARARACAPLPPA